MELPEYWGVMKFTRELTIKDVRTFSVIFDLPPFLSHTHTYTHLHILSAYHTSKKCFSNLSVFFFGGLPAWIYFHRINPWFVVYQFIEIKLLWNYYTIWNWYLLYKMYRHHAVRFWFKSTLEYLIGGGGLENSSKLNKRGWGGGRGINGRIGIFLKI